MQLIGRNYLIPLVVVIAVGGCQPNPIEDTADGISSEEDSVAVESEGGPTGESEEDGPSTEEAEGEPLQILQEDFDAAVSSALTNNYDEFDEKINLGWGQAPEDSVSILLTVNAFDSGESEAYFGVLFQDDDWIFFDTMEIRANDLTSELMNVKYNEKYTNVEGGGVVQEATVVEMDNTKRDIVVAILDDQAAKFRLSGSDGSREREFTDAEREAIEDWYTVQLGLSQGLVLAD